MKSKMIFIFFALLFVTFDAFAGASDPYEMKGAPEPKLHPTKEQAKANRAQRVGNGTSSPLLTSHGGRVLQSSKTMAIFWGSQWANATFAGDKISGMDSFFNGFSGSRYAGTATEYNDSNGYITNQSNYLGHTLDLTTPPNRAIRVSEAVAEACKITNNNPDPNALYFIFTSTTAGNVSYCAWHSYGKCSNGKSVLVAYHPRLDGIAGCDPQDTVTGHSQGLSALANVVAHELLEVITDPQLNAWYDSSGAENGDKCAWSFPSGNGVSTFANGSNWKLQMEWSNAAYSGGTGLANLSGQKGCIY